jgi:hypothetical protein
MTPPESNTLRMKSDGLTAPQPSGGAEQVRFLSWGIAICVAAYLTWSARFSMNVDGLSYLDIANAYLHRNWSAALNAYWSPVYAWILAFGLGLLQPSPSREFATVQLINFVIFLAALWAFDIFWRAQGERLSQAKSENLEFEPIAFPQWAWLGLGYSLFIWTISNSAVVSEVTPDLLVVAIVCMIGAVLVRMRGGKTSYFRFVIFGLLLGLGYLAKTAMCPLGFVFLAVSFFAVNSPSKAIPRVIVALMIFLFLSAFLIIPISRSKERFTIGDSGRLGYAWMVNRTGPRFNWQGEDPSGGVPKHATRKLLSAPVLFEFATPVAGTYPPHYDPSYWNEGLKPRFHFLQQLRVLVTSSYAYVDTILVDQSMLFAGVIILLLLSRSRPDFWGSITRNWHLWVPGLAALGMYALISVEPRFVAGFVLMIWAALLSELRLPRSEVSRKLFAYVTIVAMIGLSLSVVEKLAIRTYEWKDWSANRTWHVADGLRQMGFNEGDRVASLGSAYNAYWARLARLKIVAEIPSSSVESFWAGGPQTQSEVYGACAKLGARGVVGSEIPMGAAEPDWHKIGATGFYVHLLDPPGK